MSGTDSLTLAVDTGSATVSIALGEGSEIIAETSYSGGAGSPPLLERIDALLSSTGNRVSDVGRLIAARGPGSFTGLRSGLATLLGLRQVLEVPAVALPSFVPLAAQAPPGGTSVAAIDALRGEWFAQPFSTETRRPIAEPRIVSPEELVRWSPSSIVSFGADGLLACLDDAEGIEVQHATPLAAVLIRLAGSESLDWNPETLIEPLYLRPPTVKPPQRAL